MRRGKRGKRKRRKRRRHGRTRERTEKYTNGRRVTLESSVRA